MNFKWSTFLVASALVAVPLSGNANIIYGLEHCSHFNTSQSGTFFVQLGSFRSEHLAKQLTKKLAQYPVRTLASKGYYTVRIGPFYSLTEVHSICKSLSTITHPIKRLQTSSSPKGTTHLKKSKNKSMQSLNTSTAASALGSSSSLASSHHWYLGIDVGFMQTIMNNDAMTVPNGSDFPFPENLDHYSLERHQPIMLDVQAGHRWNRSQQWIPSFAVALRYEHVFSKNIQGLVTQYSDPEFTDYSYQWGIEADVISLYSKLDLVRMGPLMPYVDLGVGLSINRSQPYNETALPDITPRYSPNYASKTNYQFTYNLGAGLDFLLSRNFLISAGYSYQSFGKVSSGFGEGPNWGDTQLHFGTFKTNMGLIGVSYQFDNSQERHFTGSK